MVEWKKLGEIGDVCMCKRIMKHQTFDKGDVPFYKIGTFGGNADAFINKDLFLEYKSKFSFPQKGEILLSASGTIGRTVVYNGEDAYFQDSNIVWISNDETQVTNAFLYYCYQIVDWKIDGGTIKRLYNYNLKNTTIPIPSLSEQNRIVGILDTFTASIDKLKEQIAQRRKQYEYYRDQLLDLEGKEGVEMKTLGDIMQIVRGASPRPIQNYLTTEDDGVNWIKIGDVSPNDKYITKTNEKITKEGAKKSRFLHPGDFILSNSMSFGRPYILKIEGCIHDGWIAMSDYENYVCSGYLYEILNADVTQRYWRKKANNGGAMSNLNSDIVKDTPIPVPSLSEQQRIVDILDKFEASIQNLEAQLSQREKQYEYYRNKLLTFE